VPSVSLPCTLAYVIANPSRRTATACSWVSVGPSWRVTKDAHTVCTMYSQPFRMPRFSTGEHPRSTRPGQIQQGCGAFSCTRLAGGHGRYTAPSDGRKCMLHRLFSSTRLRWLSTRFNEQTPWYLNFSRACATAVASSPQRLPLLSASCRMRTILCRFVCTPRGADGCRPRTCGADGSVKARPLARGYRANCC